MPNAKNILRPTLVIGPGRSASSYFLDRLKFGHGDFDNLIENEIYLDLYSSLRDKWWCKENWKHEADEEEVERRIIATIRDAFITLFPGERPHWAMKAIWFNQNIDLLQALFPEAKYIHLARDPRTNIASMMERIGWSFERGCDAYVKSNRLALEFRKFSGRYLMVRQESFVDRREEQWEEIIDFLGAEKKQANWERYLNVSPSQEGKVGQKRGGKSLVWNELPKEVVEVALELGYSEDASR